MSDLSGPGVPTNGAGAVPLWQRVTLKQVAMGTAVVALVVLALALIVVLRYVVLLLFLGIVVATALGPAVEWLRRLGLTQSAAALVTFSLLLLLIGGIIAALVPFFISQLVQAVRDLPQFYAGFRTTVTSSDSRFLRVLGAQIPADPFSGISGSDGMALGAQVASAIVPAGWALLFGALVLLLSYYWLTYRSLAIQSVALLIPLDRRAGAVELWNQVELKLGAFVRGLAVLSFLIGLLSAIGYIAIGLPYGLTIAIIAGLLEAVPYVGPLITMALATLVGLTVSQSMALLAVGIALVIQLLENTIVVPRVMDKAVGVSPVVTLLALAVFGDLFGLLGVLLAVPLAAVFQVLLDRTVLKPAAPTQLDIGGRDKIALLRYQAQDLANDLRQQVRGKAEQIDADVDATEEDLESILLDLDGLLASVQEQRG